MGIAKNERNNGPAKSARTIKEKPANSKPNRKNIRGIETECRSLFSQFINSNNTIKVVHLLADLLLEYKKINDNEIKINKVCSLRSV